MDLGDPGEGLDDVVVEAGIDGNGGEGGAAGLEAGLVVLADVDPGIAEDGADAADDARNVAVAEDDEGAAGHDVDAEIIDADDAWEPLGEERASDAGFSVAAGEADLDVLAVVAVRSGADPADLDPAGLGEVHGVDEVDGAPAEDAGEEPDEDPGGEGRERVVGVAGVSDLDLLDPAVG